MERPMHCELARLEYLELTQVLSLLEDRGAAATVWAAIRTLFIVLRDLSEMQRSLKAIDLPCAGLMGSWATGVGGRLGS